MKTAYYANTGSRSIARALALACALAMALAVALEIASVTVARADELPPGVIYASDTDPVRITAVTFDPAHPSAGDLVSTKIVCTSNAAAVTATVGTIVVNVPKAAPGIFETTLRVPSLPLYGSHQTVIITAIRTDGAKTHRSISVDLR